jgi:CheY-like chemotaxis protein
MEKEGYKFLIVEDDANDADFIKKALMKFMKPENLFHVENGAEALDYVFKKGEFENRSEGNDPKLILLDLKTPKINGLEVLQRIKADENTKSIPVIILTSSKEEKDLTDSYKYGANSFVVKPIDYEDFENTIEGIGRYWTIINQL